MAAPLRAVVFDFYGTLTAGRSGDAQRRARVEQAGALGVDVDAFDAELTATVHERFAGAGGDVAGSLRWIAARIGARPTDAQVAEAARVRLAAERVFGEPRPEAVGVLRAVHERGLRVGLISDCSAELPAYFADLPIAPYVDAPVFSFVTGERKPDPANYLACCAQLGVEPAECLYVGDGGSNELAGARAVGMRPVHLAVTAEAGGVVYGRHLDWDGETITSLEQVLDLL
ncbi:HAD family hydrolase [uncultured Jatrophihabitans sp.]|uniref:HAD family hydrolase n=1 Tax=uncultured Jatrophihabitans sp. TaxID=1610747 RepID=UPI0035CB516D